jgi:hypothetical protein
MRRKEGRKKRRKKRKPRGPKTSKVRDMKERRKDKEINLNLMEQIEWSAHETRDDPVLVSGEAVVEKCLSKKKKKKKKKNRYIFIFFPFPQTAMPKRH